MKNYLKIAVLGIAILGLVSMPLGAKAQSSDVGLSVGTGSPSVTRGSGVAVFGLVTNNTSSKMRTTVSLSAHSPCGTETSLGEVRVSLEAGKAVALSVYYPIPADACTGMYAITISAESGKGSGKPSASTTAPSSTAYVEVQ